MVDSDWKEQEGCFSVGIWGIVDPRGRYGVVHEDAEVGEATAASKAFQSFAVGAGSYPGPEVEKAGYDAAHAAATAAAEKGMAEVKADATGEVDSPQFVCIFPPSFFLEQAFVDGLASVLGDNTPIVGVGTFVQFSHATAPSVKGLAAVLCWPSVHVTAAFSNGYTPRVDCTGVITKVEGKYNLLEIDGKPAADVLMGWMPPDVKKEFEAAEPDNLYDNPKIGGWFHLNYMASEIGIDAHEEPIYKNFGVRGFHRETRSLFTQGVVKKEERVVMCAATPDDLAKRTAKVAKSLLKSSGFPASGLRGAISLMCATNTLVDSAGGMQSCAEQMAEANGFAPCLGICGAGEQGRFGDGTNASGYGMYSCLFFTSRLVDDVLTPGRTRVLQNSTTMNMSQTGKFLEVDDE